MADNGRFQLRHWATISPSNVIGPASSIPVGLLAVVNLVLYVVQFRCSEVNIDDGFVGRVVSNVTLLARGMGLDSLNF